MAAIVAAHRDLSGPAWNPDLPEGISPIDRVVEMHHASEVVRYFPDRGKFVMLAVGCLAVGSSCLLKAVEVGASAPTVLGAAFFLLGAVNCVQSLDRSRCHIELGPEGFTERSPLRTRLIRWSEVAEFDLLPLTRRSVWVVYRLAEDDDPRISRWIKRARRREFNLSDTYGHDAREFVDLLNRWRRRFGTDHPRPVGDAARA